MVQRGMIAGRCTWPLRLATVMPAVELRSWLECQGFGQKKARGVSRGPEPPLREVEETSLQV